MSVKEIKLGLAKLTEDERREVAAFLFQMDCGQKEDYRTVVSDRLDDGDENHWVTADEFELRLREFGD